MRGVEFLTRGDSSISCDDCQTWMVKPREMTFEDWPSGSGKRIRRPDNVPTPCSTCPKCEGREVKSPAVGREVELSGKNWRTLELYHRAQAAGGTLPGADAITRRNFGVIHRIFANHSRTQLTSLVNLLPALAMRR